MSDIQTNTYWPFGGKGLDSFGVNDQPITEKMPVPNENEVLARVDAYTICASDVKMIQMGNDYPLFKGRDFDKNPARLGHELSLTVVEPGVNMQEDWPKGKRFGVQPDVYLNGERYCIGVNVTGGMSEYLLLGTEVFTSDNGSCAFPVSDDFSSAAIAQTEPVACVEAAFSKHTRNKIQSADKVLVWIDPTIERDYELDIPIDQNKVFVYDPGDHLGRKVKTTISNPEKIEILPENLFDVVIVVGNPDETTTTALTELLEPNSIFAWLVDHKPVDCVDMDIAKVHYNKINLTGTDTGKLSVALDEKNYRTDIKPGGILIISGGGGAMGRIHVMRALQHENPPKKIIVTNLGEERLVAIRETFGTLAQEKGIELITMSIADETYKKELREISGVEGASDIIVCAPGISPVNDIVEFLAPDGMLVLFAGTSYGHFGKLPLGRVAAGNVSITASSGSSVDDQLKVVAKMDKGLLDPDVNIAAVAGLYAGKDGIKAVKDGIYAGKVIVFPHLSKLPLTELKHLDQIDLELADLVNNEGWSKKAEDLLIRNYEKGRI